MSYKIYLVRHLDNDMKYVGITSQTLKQRWAGHAADRMGALYKVMRTDRERMTIEIIDEVFDKQEALKKEQEYIRIYDTAEPNGWNRQVTDYHCGPLVNHNFFNYNKPKKWKRQIGVVALGEGSLLSCPACSCTETKTLTKELFMNRSLHVAANDYTVTTNSLVTTTAQPVPESKQVVRFVFACNSCHPHIKWQHENDTELKYPPLFEYILYEYKHQIFFETIFYIQESES